jgi:Cu-Zn family superoxide dismutase
MGGDGILLDGQILYLVRGGEGVIVPVELSEDFASGKVGEAFSDPSFARPTTIAKFGDRLLVLNSQCDRASQARAWSCRLPSPPSRYLREGYVARSARCRFAYIE